MSVVVGYSATPTGQAAVRHAIEEARRRQVLLRIVHVARVGVRQETSGSMASHRRDIERLAAEAREQGVDAVAEEVMTTKSPADGVLEYLKANGADVLVIGVRRRSPVGKAVLGSESQMLMLRADCPVLGVKADPASE